MFSKYKSSYLTKLIAGFTVYTILMIGVLGGLLFNKADQTMLDEISRENEFRLQAMINTVEHTLLKKYNDYFLTKVAATVNPDSHEEMAYFMNHVKKNNYYSIAKLNENLQASSLVNEGVHNVTVMYKHSQLLVDRNHFYEQMENSKDFSFVQQLPEMDAHQWFARTNGEGKRVLTYVYTLPLLSESTSVKGYMYVDVDVDYISQKLQGMLGTPEESLYVLDQEQKLIASSNSGESLVHSRVPRNEHDMQASHMDMYSQGENVISNTNPSLSLHDWTYVTVRPVKSYFLVSNKMKKNILQACLFVLVVGILISILLSSRFYHPLKRILQTLRSTVGLPLPSRGGEHSLIDSALKNLDREINSLHKQLEERNIHQLLEGDISGMSDIRLSADSYYIVVKFRVRGQSLMSFIKCYNEMAQGIFHPLIAVNANEAAAITLPGMQKEPSLSLIIEEIERFRHWTDHQIEFDAGIGTTVCQLEDISRSYKEAEQALSYVFLFGTNCVIPFAEVREREARAEMFDYHILGNTLQAGDDQGVERFLQAFEERLRKSDCRIEAIKLALMELATVVVQIMLPHKLQQTLVYSADGSLSFKRDTLKESMEEVRKVCRSITKHIRDSSKHSHSDTIFRLKEYVENHLHEDISLDMLAEMTSISPSYISKLFSEVLHVSFTDYLTQHRLERAAELLTTTSYSVTEIAAKTGYRNVQYFCTKFKARYGVTPRKYKLSHTPPQMDHVRTLVDN